MYILSANSDTTAARRQPTVTTEVISLSNSKRYALVCDHYGVRFFHRGFFIKTLQFFDAGAYELRFEMSQGFADNILGKVFFKKHLPLLSQATTENDDVTPGYIYAEIEAITYQSPDHCQKLAEFLNQRLQNPSALVKLKVLKIMYYLTNNGPPHFRQYFRIYDGQIKEANKYCLPSSQLFGTEFCKEVQRISQDILNILFDAEKIKKDDVDIQSFQPKNKTHLSGLGISKYSSAKYEGFGSTPVKKETTIKDRMTDLLEKLTVTSDKDDECVKAVFTDSLSIYKPVETDFEETTNTIELPSLFCLKPKVHITGRSGGGWESDEDKLSAALFLDTSSVGSSVVSLKHLERSIEEQVSNSEEEELIRNFCKETNFAVKPSELDNINARCSKLNLSIIIQAIKNVFHDSEADTSTLLRTLLIVEWLLHTDFTSWKKYADTLFSELEYLSKSTIENIIMTKIKKLKVIIKGHLTVSD